MDDFKETGWDHISGDKTATFSTSEKKWIKLTRDKVFTVRLYRKRNDGFSAIVERRVVLLTVQCILYLRMQKICFCLTIPIAVAQGIPCGIVVERTMGSLIPNGL